MSILNNTVSTADANIFSRVDAYCEDRLSTKRLMHSREVAKLAQELCIKYNVDPGKGAIAGIAHDLAREWRAEELLAYVSREKIPADEWELRHPVVLHGRVAAHVAAGLWSLEPDICRAVADHVLGAPMMPVLSQILFVADFCEPTRDFLFSHAREGILRLPLGAMVSKVAEMIFEFLDADHAPIAPVSRRMYTFFTGEKGQD